MFISYKLTTIWCCQPCQHPLIIASTGCYLWFNRASEPVRRAASLTRMRNRFTWLERTEEPISEHNLLGIKVATTKAENIPSGITLVWQRRMRGASFPAGAEMFLLVGRIEGIKNNITALYQCTQVLWLEDAAKLSGNRLQSNYTSHHSPDILGTYDIYQLPGEQPLVLQSSYHCHMIRKEVEVNDTKIQYFSDFEGQWRPGGSLEIQAKSSAIKKH